MWVGGRNPRGERGGITWWDMEGEEWHYFESAFISDLNSDEVWSIAADESDVWFGTSEGLARYVRDEQQWRTYTSFDNLWDDRVNSIVFAGGDIWIGTAMGINRIGWPSMVITQVRDKPLIRRWIYQLEFDGLDLWAGTDRGLYRLQELKGQWGYVKMDPSLLVQEVTAVSSCGDEIWFGTNDGVACYHADEDRWEGFPAAHHPTGGMIHTILADSAIVWVGKENGLLKYVKREKRWKRYTRADGLIDNSVRWMLLDGDYIWLGTGRGLTRFYWNGPHLVD